MRFLALAFVAALALPSAAFAQDDSGFSVSNDAIASYVQTRGGADTFGAPISRELALQGVDLQLFENAAVQVQPDGSVSLVQLTTDGWLPYTHFEGLTVPAADPAIAYVAPSPEQPNYPARLATFLSATVPVEYDAAVWGLPTSLPTADPNNPNFVYQRFQNGILMVSSGSWLPLGAYLKDVLTGAQLPADLAKEAAASALHKQLVAAEAFVPDAS